MPDHRSRRYEARDYLGVDHPLLEALRTAPLVRTPRFLTLSLTLILTLTLTLTLTLPNQVRMLLRVKLDSEGSLSDLCGC